MSSAVPATTSASRPLPPAIAGVPGAWRRALRSRRVLIGGGFLLFMILLCAGTLPWTAISETNSRLYFDRQNMQEAWTAPSFNPTGQLAMCLGTDRLGRSVLGRALTGGAISLGIGVMAAAIAVVIGVSVGLIAGYAGGWLDNLLMRIVDVLYSLPYVLMIILLKIALDPLLLRVIGSIHVGKWHMSSPQQAANLIVLFLSIGLVSWLTMARVVRGQVLSLRSQPFIEACRALGLPSWQILLRHLLPNLVGPVIIYATLTIPVAILQESFLSFLGIGIQPPMPTWGSLASEGLGEGLNPIHSRPWLLVVPCLLLALTLLSLNFVGDALRDILDPRREQAKV